MAAFELRGRSPREVLDDHLRLALEWRFEEDMERNYAPDVLFLSGHGVHRGHAGLLELAHLLEEELPEGTFVYHNVLVEGEVGFLEWTGTGKGARVRDGADSFLIRDGKIVAQTIHYTLEPAEDGADA